MTSSDAQAIDLRTAADADVEAAQDLPAVLGPGDVIMLVTDSAAGLESRPITCAEVLPTGIRCLIDQTASWVEPMANGPRPPTSPTPTPRRTATSRSPARLRSSAARRRSTGCGAPWPRPSSTAGDPKAAVLDIAVTSGEWWSGPSSKVTRVVSLVRAAVTNQPESVGDHGPVT